MSKGTKLLIIFLAIIFTLSLGAKYYKFNVSQDYYISAEVACDTETESCFVWDCDIEDEECDQTPYKYIWKHATEVPYCDPLLEDCPDLTCNEDEDDCEITYCSSETLGDEEFCYES